MVQVTVHLTAWETAVWQVEGRGSAGWGDNGGKHRGWVGVEILIPSSLCNLANSGPKTADGQKKERKKKGKKEKRGKYHGPESHLPPLARNSLPSLLDLIRTVRPSLFNLPPFLLLHSPPLLLLSPPGLLVL